VVANDRFSSHADAHALSVVIKARAFFEGPI